jgi:uncharacterized ferritin-like protein (DUF455 family)
VSMNPRDFAGFQALENVIAQAVADPDYRARLETDPHGVLEAAGLETDPNVRITVLQNSDNEVFLVLPAEVEDDAVLEIDEVNVTTLARFWPF